MEYIILSTNLPDLIELVNEYIAAGWRPQGGVCNGYSTYLQAMIRG